MLSRHSAVVPVVNKFEIIIKDCRLPKYDFKSQRLTVFESSQGKSAFAREGCTCLCKLYRVAGANLQQVIGLSPIWSPVFQLELMCKNIKQEINKRVLIGPLRCLHHSCDVKLKIDLCVK